MAPRFENTGKILAVAVIAAALCACQQTGVSATAKSQDSADTAAAATAQTIETAYGLHFQAQDSSVKLAYGYPDFDAVRLMLECAPGSGQVEVSDVAPADETRLVLTSADVETTLTGEVFPAGGAPVIYASARADDPVMVAFHQTGRIEVGGAAPYRIEASAAERAGVDAFFEACRTA